MNDLRLYGKYYKKFKGRYGIPDKVTIVGIDGDTVTYIMGHHSKSELAYRGRTLKEAINNMCLVKMKCNANKILTTITARQKQILDEEDKMIQEMINKADEALEKFKN